MRALLLLVGLLASCHGRPAPVVEQPADSLYPAFPGGPPPDTFPDSDADTVSGPVASDA